jgi:hypothetical protein
MEIYIYQIKVEIVSIMQHLKPATWIVEKVVLSYDYQIDFIA